ncbi:MAG: FtsX-like permease family protein [Polyangia bacterium]
MASLFDRYEPFIAWRYLYRRRQGSGVFMLTLLFGALSAISLGAVFLAHGNAQVIGTSASLPALILFLFFLLLNVFSGFTAVSIVGVAIGVLALVVVLSVTSGFQQSFKQKVLGVNAHVIVMKYGQDFSDYRDIEKRSLKLKHIVAAAPFTFYEGMLAAGHSMSGSIIKGIDPVLSPEVLELRPSMRVGRVEDLAKRVAPNDGGPPLPSIFVGEELAKKLKLKIGERVRIVSPKTDLDPSRWGQDGGGGPATVEFRMAGLFYTGFQEYDSRLAYVNIKDAQAFFFPGQGDVVTGVELKLDDIDAARDVGKKLYDELGGPPYRVIDWEELNHNLFAALRTQKVAITVILTVIIIVAAFNIIAAMTMLVIGKSKEIAILKSMGMRSSGVARVFMTTGLLIGMLGTACGLAIGLTTIAILRRYNYQLDPHVYLIDQLPVKVNVDELVMTACITLAICLVATIYPALKAAWLPPVEGLRYE